MWRSIQGRGLEPDSGTVFEVGFAVALGKPVVVYGVPAGSYASRVCAAMECTQDARGLTRERDRGVMVEGLGQLDSETGGRPAELFRFRRELLGARPVSGLALPLLRE